MASRSRKSWSVVTEEMSIGNWASTQRRKTHIQISVCLSLPLIGSMWTDNTEDTTLIPETPTHSKHPPGPSVPPSPPYSLDEKLKEEVAS